MIFGAILAGGIGNRIGESKPKQFIEINNKPILAYSIEKFINVNKFDKIIISSPKIYLKNTKDLVNKYFPNNEQLVVIAGGKERKDTIINSINYSIENECSKDSIMVTHDAARIFVTENIIEKSIKYGKLYGAASPVIPATDVIFQSNAKHKLDSIPLRKSLFHAQTPQSFNIYDYIDLYNSLTQKELKLLDEAMILFQLRNKKVHLFEGEHNNFKITQPIDIKLAEALLKE